MLLCLIDGNPNRVIHKIPTVTPLNTKYLKNIGVN
jgi:hypothetical protein